jgi:hypothetical protein
MWDMYGYVASPISNTTEDPTCKKISCTPLTLNISEYPLEQHTRVFLSALFSMPVCIKVAKQVSNIFRHTQTSHKNYLTAKVV